MDLFDVLDAHRKIQAEDWLTMLSVEIMSQTTSEEDFRKFTTSLRKQAGIDEETAPKFDEVGFERLKMQLKMGL